MRVVEFVAGSFLEGFAGVFYSILEVFDRGFLVVHLDLGPSDDCVSGDGANIDHVVKALEGLFKKEELSIAVPSVEEQLSHHIQPKFYFTIIIFQIFFTYFDVLIHERLQF